MLHTYCFLSTHLPGMMNALASPPAQASGCSTGWFGKMLVGQKQGPGATQLGRCATLQPPEQTPTAALRDEFFMEAHSRREKKFNSKEIKTVNPKGNQP